ncbi:MAG: MFS transporter, partial [Acidobacteria bacterium]|nr:MFS transporter [Acidobacteriota bacterium]
MRRLFHAAFSIRPDEFPLVQAFFALFAMVGVSITIGATAADTLFLSRYTAAEAETLLPLVYVGIGFVGVLTASLYGRMRERLPRQMSLVGTLFALAASLVLFRQALTWGGKPSFFALVIWIEVCTVLSITLVFSHSGDSFAGRDAKRLYGYISGGLAVGTIVSGYAVEPVVARLGAEGLLYVAAASLVAAAGLGVLTFRLRRSSGGEEDDSEGDGDAESVPLRALLSNRFLRYTFGLSLAGLLCACFTDYQLKITASRSMDEAALAVFFGKYYAWLGVAGLVIQFLLVGAILRRLGLSNALLIPPALLFVTCIGFVAWPVVLAAAATEFVRESFSGTLETPSKELLYLPLSTRLRLRAQAFSGGVLEAGGQAVAGLLIVGVMLVVPSIRWLGLFTLAGAATWLFLARALRRQYETVLGESLRAGHGAVDLRALLGRPEAEGVLAGMLEEGAQPGTATRAAAALELLAGRPLSPRLAAAVGALSRSGGEAVAARAVALLGESRDAAQLPVLRAAARDERPRVRAAAVLAICQVAEEKAVDEVGLDAMSATFGVMSREVHEAALVGCLRHGGAPGQDIARPRLAALVQSADADDREEAARVLGRVGGRSLAAELFPLLTDPHPSVRDAALRAAREVADPVLLPVLCELLSYASTFRAARAALEAMPRGSVRALSERALDSGRPPAVRAALAQALASV